MELTTITVITVQLTLDQKEAEWLESFIGNVPKGYTEPVVDKLTRETLLAKLQKIDWVRGDY